MDRTVTTLASNLDAALKAANVPIVGVVIGDVADRTTWKVTPAYLQPQAQMVIDAFNPSDPAWEDAAKDREMDGLKAIRALADATFELKTNAWTKAQFLARVKAIYRGL